MDRQEGLPPFDVEETVWCEGCRKLKKEVTRLQEEHAINYQTLKQKIISTDLLIRKYRTKCEEFDVQSKRLEDMSKKLDRSQLDCEMLETQLKASLQSTEPLKQTRVDLEAKLKVKDREILNLKNSLEGAEMIRKQFEALIASNDILSSEEDKKQREKRMQALESSNSKYANQVKSAKDELKSLKSDLSKSSKRGRDVEIKLSKSLTKLEKYWKLLKDNDLLPKGERKPNKAKILDESVGETSQEEFEDTGSLIDEVGHHLEAEPSVDDDNNNEANEDNIVDDVGGFMDDDVGFMNDGAEDDDDPDEDDYPSIDFRFTFSPICAPVSPLPPSPVPAKQTKTSSFANPSTSIAFDNEDSMDIMAESLQSQLLEDVTTPYTKSVRRSPRLSSGKDRGLFSSADEQDVISKSESFRPKRVKKQKMQGNKSEQPGKGADKTAIKPSPRLQSKIDFAGTQAEGYDLETSLPAVSDSSEEEEEGGTASFGSRKGSSPFPVHNLIEDMKRLKELAERTKSSDEEEEESVLLKLRPRNTKEVLQQSCPLADRSGTRSPLSSAKQSCSTDEKENVTENLQNRSMTPKKPLGTLSKSNEHVKCAVSDSDLTDRVTRSMSQPVEEKTKQNGLGPPRPKSAMAKMEDGFLTPTPPKSKKLRGISPKNVETEQSPKKQTRTRTTSLPLDLSDVESSTLRKSPRSRSEALGSTDNLQLKKSLRSQSAETLNVKDTDSPVRVLRSRLRDSLSDSSESQVSSLKRTSSPVKQKKDPFVKKKKASTEELSKLVHGTEVKNPVSNVSEIAKCSSPELKKGHVLAKQQTDNDDVLGMKSSSTGDVMDIDGMEAVDSGQMDTEVADRTIVASGPDAEGCLESVKAAGAPCNAGDTSGMDIKIDSSPDSVKTSNHAAEKKHSSSESDIFSEKGHNKDNLDETLKGSPSSSKTVTSDSVSDSSVCMKTPVKCSKAKSTPRTMTSGKDSGPSFKVKKVKAVSLPSKKMCSSKSGSQEQLVSSDSSDTSLEEDNQKKRKQSAQKRKSPKQHVIDTSSESEKDEDERTNAKDSGGHFASDYSPGSDKESDDEDQQPPETRKTRPEQVAVKSAVPLSSSDSEADDTKRSLQVTHARKPKKKFNTKHKGNGKKDSDKATRNPQKVFTSKEFISTESDSDESESIQAKKLDNILPDVPSGCIASKSPLSELNKDRMDLVNETKPISSQRGRDKSSRIFKDRNSKLSSQQGENRGTFPSLTASFVKSDTVLPGSSNETRGDTGHEEVGDIPAVPEPNAFSEEGEKTSEAKGESSRPSPMAPKRRVRPSKHRYQPLETEKDFVDIILERRRVTRSASDKSGSEAKQSEDSEPPEIVRKAEAQRKTDLVVEKLKSAHEKKKFVTNLEKSRLNVLKRKSGTESGNSSDDVKRKGQTALAGPEVSSASEMEGVCSVGKSESVTDSDMDTIQVLVYQENLQSSASESVFSSPVMCQDNLQSSASDSVFSSPVRSVKSLDLTQDKGCDGSTKSPLKSVAGVTTVVEKVNKDKLSVKPVSTKHDSAKTIQVRPESVPTESVISNSADVTEKESNPQTNSIQSTSGTEPVITRPLTTTPDSSRGTGSDIAGAVLALPAPTPMNSSRAVEVEATEDENTMKGSICGSESSHIDEPETSVPSETGLLPAPGSGSTRTQEETQGESTQKAEKRQLSSSNVDMPSKDQNCKENRDLKVNENVHKVVGKVQEGEQASSSLTGGMLTSPSLEMDVGKCPRHKRLLRTGVASKTEDETNTVVKDVTSKDKGVAEDVTAKDVSDKGVAEDVTAKDVSDKGVAEDVTAKDVLDKGVAEDVTAKDVSDMGVAEDVTSLNKGVAKVVTRDVSGKDVAKDVMSKNKGVDKDVTSDVSGNDVAKDVTSDVSGNDVAKDVTSNVTGKEVAKDVTSKDKGVDKDVTSDVSGEDVAKDVTSKDKGVDKDVTSDVSGKDVAKDVTSKDKGMDNDVTSDVSGKDVAKDVTSKDKGVAEDVISDVTGKHVAKDVTSDLTGKDVAKDVTRKEKGVVKEKTKDVSSKDKEVSGEETKDVTMDKDVTCYNKDVTKNVTIMDKDLNKDVSSKLKDVTSKDKDLSNGKDMTINVKCLTEDKDVTKDKDMIKDKDVTKDKDITKDKDVTSTDKGLTEDKDVTKDKDMTKDKDVTSTDKALTEDKDVIKDKDMTKDKDVIKDKDMTKDKDVIKDKDVTSIDKALTEDKDVTSIDKGLTEDKDVTKDKGVTSEDSSRSKDSDGQGVHRKMRRKLQRVSASEEQLPQAECPAEDTLCPRTSRRTTRANQLKRANMKRQMSFDQEEAKTVDEPSTVEKKTKKVSKELDSLRKRTKEEETEKSGDIGINATLEQDKEEEKGPEKESCNTVMKASQDEEDVNAEDSLVVKNKKFEETIKGNVEQRETSSEVGQDVEEVEHVQEDVNLKEASVVSHESVRADVEAREGCEKTQEDGKKITDTDEMSGSEEDSDDGSKRKRVESQNSFGFTVNNAETTSSPEGSGLLDTLNLIPELQELEEEEDTFAEDVEEPKSIMAGSGSQTPERVASPEIVALTQGTFSSISALLRSEFSLASVSTTPLPPSPMNFLRIRDPVSPLPPSPTGSLDDPTPLTKGKSKRKTLTKSKNRAETPPTPDGTKFTKIAPLDEAVSSMSSGTQRRVARLARPQADLPKFGADLSSTTVKPKAVYSKPGTAGQGDATFFPVLRSAEISLAKQQLAKRLENKEKKEQERKTRKRKSSESEAAPQKKQVMKQETRNLQSVSRVERVLEEFLQSTDATPTSFCNTVVGKKLETDVAMEIFRAIVKTLQTSCSDQLPLVYAACSAGSDIKGPFMTDTEKRLLELITTLLEEYMDCPRHQLMELLWNSIFLPCVALPGRLALCRMFTALCRCEGDLEQVRVFIFKLLTSGYLSYVESVLAVVGVWPLTLMGGADMPPMIQVVRHTILEAGTAEGADGFVQKLMMCYQKICQWPPLSESPADLLSSLINRLKQSIITKQHHGCIYETMKSIELLLWKQGWKFVYMHFVNRHFNSVTDAWKAKGDNSSVEPRFLITMIRIFGNVYHLPKFSHKHKDFLKVLKRCFISTLERPTEHFEVQLYAAEVLAELSPFHPQFIMDALAEWYKHNRVMVPAQQRTCLEQTRNALIAKMPTFFVEKFA